MGHSADDLTGVYRTLGVSCFSTSCMLVPFFWVSSFEQELVLFLIYIDISCYINTNICICLIFTSQIVFHVLHPYPPPPPPPPPPPAPPPPPPPPTPPNPLVIFAVIYNKGHRKTKKFCPRYSCQFMYKISLCVLFLVSCGLFREILSKPIVAQ